MWTNWAGDQRCEPAAVERPTAVGEVVGAVERAVAAGRCVRVAGSGHSFTGAALTDGALLSLDRMGALLDADPRQRPGPRRGRHHGCTPSARRSPSTAWRCPTWATSTSSRSPARSRPPRTAPASRCATSPRRCARCAWSPPPGDGARGRRRRGPARGARRGRRARGRHRGHAADGPGLHAARRRRAGAAGRGPRRARRARGRPPPLRVLRLPARRQRADAHQRRRRRAAAAATAVARMGRRRAAGQPRLPAGVRHRPRVPAARSRRSTAS